MRFGQILQTDPFDVSTTGESPPKKDFVEYWYYSEHLAGERNSAYRDLLRHIKSETRVDFLYYLVGARGTGKTSLIQYVQHAEGDVDHIYIDLASVAGEVEPGERLCRAILNYLESRRVKNLGARLDGVPAKPGDSLLVATINTIVKFPDAYGRHFHPVRQFLMGRQGESAYQYNSRDALRVFEQLHHRDCLRVLMESQFLFGRQGASAVIYVDNSDMLKRREWTMGLHESVQEALRYGISLAEAELPTRPKFSASCLRMVLPVRDSTHRHVLSRSHSNEDKRYERHSTDEKRYERPGYLSDASTLCEIVRRRCRLALDIYGDPVEGAGIDHENQRIQEHAQRGASIVLALLSEESAGRNRFTELAAPLFNHNYRAFAAFLANRVQNILEREDDRRDPTISRISFEVRGMLSAGGGGGGAKELEVLRSRIEALFLAALVEEINKDVDLYPFGRALDALQAVKAYGNKGYCRPLRLVLTALEQLSGFVPLDYYSAGEEIEIRRGRAIAASEVAEALEGLVGREEVETALASVSSDSASARMELCLESPGIEGDPPSYQLNPAGWAFLEHVIPHAESVARHSPVCRAIRSKLPHVTSLFSCHKTPIATEVLKIDVVQEVVASADLGATWLFDLYIEGVRLELEAQLDNMKKKLMSFTSSQGVPEAESARWFREETRCVRSVDISKVRAKVQRYLYVARSAFEHARYFDEFRLYLLRDEVSVDRPSHEQSPQRLNRSISKAIVSHLCLADGWDDPLLRFALEIVQSRVQNLEEGNWLDFNSPVIRDYDFETLAKECVSLGKEEL